MSGIGGISIGTSPATWTRPAANDRANPPQEAAADKPSFGEELIGKFRSMFDTSLINVFERGAAGEFDDPLIAMEERVARDRLAAAAGSVTGGGTSSVVDPAAAVAQRDLLDARVRQSEARLVNISRSLARDFPQAAQLSSASSGSWDPATFQPRSKEEAEAFAQRMVIDATEAAARLEIIMTQRDAAVLAAKTSGQGGSSDAVAALDHQLKLQQSYTDKLTTIVDKASGGSMGSAGRGALSLSSVRTDKDISAAEIATTLKARGADAKTIERIVGAMELAVEQEQSPEGSKRLREVAIAATSHYTRIVQSRIQDMRKQSADDHVEQTKLDEKHSDQRRVQRADAEERAIERQMAMKADFERWLKSMVA